MHACMHVCMYVCMLYIYICVCVCLYVCYVCYIYVCVFVPLSPTQFKNNSFNLSEYFDEFLSKMNDTLPLTLNTPKINHGFVAEEITYIGTHHFGCV